MSGPIILPNPQQPPDSPEVVALKKLLGIPVVKSIYDYISPKVDAAQSVFDRAATPEAFGSRPGVGGFFHTGLNDLGAGIVALASPLVHPLKTTKTGIGLMGQGMGVPNGLTDEAEQELIKPFIPDPTGKETGGKYAGRLGGQAVAILPSLVTPELLDKSFGLATAAGSKGLDLVNPSRVVNREMMRILESGYPEGPTLQERASGIGEPLTEQERQQLADEKDFGPQKQTEPVKTVTPIGVGRLSKQSPTQEGSQNKPSLEKPSGSEQSGLSLEQTPTVTLSDMLTPTVEDINKNVNQELKRGTPDVTLTPVGPVAGPLLQMQGKGFNFQGSSSPYSDNPEVSQLNQIFGIIPQPNTNTGATTNTEISHVAAAEETKKLVNSNLISISTQPIQIDENGSRFWNTVELANEANAKPALVDPLEEYRKSIANQEQEYREATQRIVNTIPLQHPDEAVLRALGETGDPYSFTKARPSLGRLPSLVPHEQGPTLEGYHAHQSLKKLFGVK